MAHGLVPICTRLGAAVQDTPGIHQVGDDRTHIELSCTTTLSAAAGVAVTPVTEQVLSCPIQGFDRAFGNASGHQSCQGSEVALGS
jgi:hypothetical protein